MKHLYRTAAALAAAAVLMVTLLAGCGETVSVTDDATKYVQAVLDLMCTGEYDQSVKFSDIEEGKELETRTAMIDSIVDSAAGQNNLSDEQRAQLTDFISRAFAASRYSIKEVTETDDGECDVTVSIEPLKVFDGVGDAIDEEVSRLTADSETAIAMSEEEQAAALYDAMFRQLNQNLENPQYAPAVDIVVHYGLLEGTDGQYGIDEEAGTRLGENLFYRDGM